MKKEIKLTKSGEYKIAQYNRFNIALFQRVGTWKDGRERWKALRFYKSWDEAIEDADLYLKLKKISFKNLCALLQNRRKELERCQVLNKSSEPRIVAEGSNGWQATVYGGKKKNEGKTITLDLSTETD